MHRILAFMPEKNHNIIVGCPIWCAHIKIGHPNYKLQITVEFCDFSCTTAPLSLTSLGAICKKKDKVIDCLESQLADARKEPDRLNGDYRALASKYKYIVLQWMN